MNDNFNHTDNPTQNKFLIIYLKAHPIKYFILHSKSLNKTYKNRIKELNSFLGELDILENE